MNIWRSFVKPNAPWLAAGGLLTFGSSFGQTYFISLFAGEIRGEFGLSHSDWGGIYAAGTLASAALMLLIGGVVDGYRTRTLVVINLCIFACLCAGMALVPGAWILPVVIFGLRFCGQGMMSHMAVVSVGRWFAAARGRALAVTSMGFSLGEAVLPLIFVAIMGVIGWRGAWGIAALFLLAYIPIFLFLLAKERSPKGRAEAFDSAGMLGRHWTRGNALRHWLFWACVPGLLAHPVFGTAYFFQQVHLVEVKGWTLAGFAGLMPFYTGAAVAAVLTGGWLVDRLGAGRLMPFYLLPMAVGFWVISEVTSLTLAAVGMVFLGTMQGFASVVLGAFWPEYYGTRNLGAIRSVAVALMVFATGIGPLVTGYLIDAGVDWNMQLKGMAILSLCASGIFGLAFMRARPLLTT